MRLSHLLGLTLLLSCADDGGGNPVRDGSGDTNARTPDAAAEVGTVGDAASETGDAHVGLPPAVTGLRLERPSDLPRPPNGRLPRDLLPPLP